MNKVLYIFGQMTDNDIDWLINNGKKEKIKKSTVLIQKGKLIDNIYIVLDGLFGIYSGKNSDTLITKLDSGEIIGEMSFVDTTPPFVTVIADMDSLVYSISKSSLMDKIEKDSGFGCRFFRAISVFLADRLRENTVLLGYGNKDDIKEYMNDIQQLDSLIIDKISIAGDRFHRMRKKMMDN